MSSLHVKLKSFLCCLLLEVSFLDETEQHLYNTRTIFNLCLCWIQIVKGMLQFISYIRLFFIICVEIRKRLLTVGWKDAAISESSGYLFHFPSSIFPCFSTSAKLLSYKELRGIQIVACVPDQKELSTQNLLSLVGCVYKAKSDFLLTLKQLPKCESVHQEQ